MDIQAVKKAAEEGNLGKVITHPKTGEPMVIWPGDMQSRPESELPEPGMGKYKVNATGPVLTTIGLDIDDPKTFDQVQRVFLTLAHALGSPADVAPRAELMVYRSCFILQWANFETFLRTTVQSLMGLHPRLLIAGKRAAKKITYEELLEKSDGFTSVAALFKRLVDDETEAQEAEGRSVHGLINFLKSELSFKNDPYETVFFLKGQRLRTSYNSLLELKEVRNALMHDGGRQSESFFNEHPTVPRREETVVIEEQYYLRSKLSLASLAYSIAHSLDNGDYAAP